MGKSARFLIWVLTVTAGALHAQKPAKPQEERFPWLMVPKDAIFGFLTQGFFAEPRGVFFDRTAEELFVLDGKRGLVGIYDPEATPRFAFGGAKALLDPTQVHVDADGKIFVLDSEQTKIKVFNYRGDPQPALSFLAPTGPDGALEPVRVRAFTRSESGETYVAAEAPPRVIVYDAERKLIRTIESSGRRGRGPVFKTITGLALSSKGLLAVTDFQSIPVQLFDPEGRFLRGFGLRDISAQGFAAPIAVAFDERDFLYVADLLRHNVKIFDVLGRFQEVFGGWIAPEFGGRNGRAPGEMLYPTSVAVQPGGLVFVSERFGRRIQVFRRVERDSDQGRELLRR